MKSLIVMSLIASIGATAGELVRTTAFTSAVPVLSSAGTSELSASSRLKAAAVLNDAQEAIQSGRVSVLLDSYIKDIQSQNSDLSEIEAMEILVNQAEEILKK